MWAPSVTFQTASTHISSPQWSRGGGRWWRGGRWILTRCRGRPGGPHPGGSMLGKQFATRWSPRSLHPCPRAKSRLTEADPTLTVASCAAERKQCCCCCWEAALSRVYFCIFIFAVKLCKTLSCVQICWSVCKHYLDPAFKLKLSFDKFVFYS